MVARLLAPLGRAATYGGLAFSVSALPLGAVGLTLLVVGWSLVVGLAITPLVIVLPIGLRYAVSALARFEAAIARTCLGGPRGNVAVPVGGNLWNRFLGTFRDPAFWREQSYLVLRFTLGWAIAIAQLALLYAALWSLTLPLTYEWLVDTDLGGYRVDTLAEALVGVPLGILLLLASAHLVGPVRRLWSWLTARLLSSDAGRVTRTPAESRTRRRTALTAYAAVAAGIGAVLVATWALTTRAYFWPAWPLLALLFVGAVAAWVVVVLERPAITRRVQGSAALAGHAGIAALLGLSLVAVWALTGRGYFWPAWVFLGLAVGVVVHWAFVAVRRQLDTRQRIEELEETRAGAVDAQESELRRIERDLHDGAQARLVALGMSIGMAEEKLATDPEGARALLAEARSGAREALEELRDLARGIHPPILTDRGLEAAVGALASRAPMPVAVVVDVPGRPSPALESAAYFVVAEALANAIKHAHATHVDVKITRVDDVLAITVSDDGVGGARSSGRGLTGLDQRVRALDGTLRIESPLGGPTSISVELQCA